MPNFFLGAWAGVVLVFLYLTTRRPPTTPLKPIEDGAQYEFNFTGTGVGYVSPDQPARWSKTPCGRTSHVRAWSDLH